jgi:hypothetical protein
MGSRSSKLGKWSPKWEGLYRIKEVILEKKLYGSEYTRDLAAKGNQ